MKPPKITVIMADQSLEYRKALNVLLKYEGIKVIGEAGSASELLNLLKSEVPDVLIYDELSYSENFSIVAKSLFAIAPDLKILILSLDNSDGYINDYIKNGVFGFCDKNMKNYDDLTEAIKLVSSGKKYFPVLNSTL